MSEAPELKPMQKIHVGIHNCIVRKVFSNDYDSVAQVVFINQGNEPITHDVVWNGNAWEFPDTPGYYGGHIFESDPCVQKLRRGL